MKRHIAYTLLFAVFFCSISAMEEDPEELEDASIPTLKTATPRQRELAKLHAVEWKEIIEKEKESFDETKMMEEISSLHGDLPVLTEQAFYDLQKEDYKKLAGEGRVWTNKNLYTLFGLRFYPGIGERTSLDLTEGRVKWKGNYLPNLSELWSLTELKTGECELKQLNGALLPQSLTVLDVSRCKLAHCKSYNMKNLCALQKLIASSNSFTQVDQDRLPPNITKLDLSNNRFVQPEKMALQKLTCLTMLDLSKNSELTGCFAKMLPTSLQELNLEDNKKLQPGQIQLSGLPLLATVSLYSADLSTLEGAQFPALITDVDLSFNLQGKIFNAYLLPPGVQKLRLFGCELKELRNCAKNFKALAELNLSYCFNGQVFDCTKLPNTVTKLIVYGPKTCKNIQHLQHITEFDFTLNDFDEFPDFSKNSALTILKMSCSQNKLKCREEKLNTQLQSLYLNNCEMALPQAFIKLLALQQLNIMGMKLEAIPNLSKLIALTKLNVSKNKLTQLDGKFFPDSLEDLNAAENDIKKLALAACINLTKLNIIRNKVQKIDGATDLPASLQELNCSRQRYSDGSGSFSSDITNLNKLPSLDTIAY